MCRSIRFLIMFAIFLLVDGCATLPETNPQVESALAPPPTQTRIASPTSESRSTPTSLITETPEHTPGKENHDCSAVEQLPTDSGEAQQIVEEFIVNYKEQYPTEYMGMAILHRVYRLEDWAIVTGSIAGEGTDVIAVRLTPKGYQIAEFIHIFPLESPEELDSWVIQPFLEKLSEAPAALFTCMDPSWLQPNGRSRQPVSVYQLAYVSTDDYTTEGVTEIHTLLSDGSNQNVLLQTATNVATVNPLPATMPPSEPTTPPLLHPSQQVTPYTGPVNINAMAFAPSGDVLYLARTIDIQRNQDGIEQTLYNWPEAIPDLLADFSADSSVLAARLNNGDLAIVSLPQGKLLHTLQLHVDFVEWPISLALSADGSQLAVALGENTVQLWDVNTGKLFATPMGSGLPSFVVHPITRSVF